MNVKVDKVLLNDLRDEADRMKQQLLVTDMTDEKYSKLLEQYQNVVNLYFKLTDGRSKTNAEIANTYAGIGALAIGGIAREIIRGYWNTAWMNFEKEGHIMPQALRSFFNGLNNYVRRK